MQYYTSVIVVIVLTVELTSVVGPPCPVNYLRDARATITGDP